jgi:DNA-binding beta-propeller fold protein YncE
MPTGLAVNGQGNRVYIADTGGVSSDKHHILEFDVETGELLQTIGRRGKGDLEFNLPKDLTLDENNHLYVVDSGNFRIQVIDLADNSLVRSFGKIGRRAGQFSRPKGIALDSDGNIYVSDAAFGNFQIFNSQGQLLMFVGSRSNLLAPGKFMLNSGIAVDEDGRVLMADQFHAKFDIFRPAALDEEAGYLGIFKEMDDEIYKKLEAERVNEKSSEPVADSTE